MGKKSLQNQIKYALNQKMALGKSRHQAKAELRKQQGAAYRFGAATESIHSIRARQTYEQWAQAFARWCVEMRGVKKYARLEQCRQLAPEYLQALQEQGKSSWSIKTARAALGKLYGEQITFAVATRSPDKIRRSRGSRKMDAHFSEARNCDLIIMAKATGGRRADLAGLQIDSFQKIAGILFVEFLRSKGGRDRIAPVLPELVPEVTAILEKAGSASGGRVFSRIHSKADIHSYRREYAQALYQYVSTNSGWRDQVLQVYPARYEPKVKGSAYTTRRGGHSRTFDRDDLYLCSQALGHNRLEVTVTHYLL